MGVLALMLRPVMAADVSKADLAKMEREVQAQNLEHKKLQAQATQISLELTRISKDMIASAKQIQNSEEKISRMESELETLRADLKKAEENFVVEDDNLIKTLSALQNLALKPTEALFAKPCLICRRTPPASAKIWKKSKTRKIWSKNRLRALSVRKKFWKMNMSR